LRWEFGKWWREDQSPLDYEKKRRIQSGTPEARGGGADEAVITKVRVQMFLTLSRGGGENKRKARWCLRRGN